MIMKGMLVILIATVVIGIILYLVEVFYYRRRDAERQLADSAEDTNMVEGETELPSVDDKGADKREGEEQSCCGLHLVCDKNSLSPVTPEIIYYDDDELDRFSGRASDNYSSEEIEEFREIMLTLLPSDAAGWSRSLQLRNIVLPPEIREELLMIVAEERTRNAK